MAGNKFMPRAIDYLVNTGSASAASGQPWQVGDISGVLLTDGDASGRATINTEGSFNLCARAFAGVTGGVCAIAIGDTLFYAGTGTNKLSKDPSGKRFGLSREIVTSASSGATRIEIILQQSPTIGGGDIDPSAICALSIAASAVGTSELAIGSVTTPILAASAVTSAKIDNDAIVADNIVASAVGTSELAIGSVTTAILAADAVTSAKVANDAILAANIIVSAVGTSELAIGSVTTAVLDADAVTSAKMAVDSVLASAIGTSAVGTSELAIDSVTTAVLAASAVTTAIIAADAVTSAKVAADAILAAAIATSAVGVGEVTVAVLNADNHGYDDDSGLTAAENVNDALDVLLKNATTEQGFFPITDYSLELGSALTRFVDSATLTVPGKSQIGTDEVVLRWNPSAGTHTKVTAHFALPPDISAAAGINIHSIAALIAPLGGDTPDLEFEVYLGDDADAAGADPEIVCGASYKELILNVDSAVSLAAQKTGTVIFGPATGENVSADVVVQLPLWGEYTKVILP